MTATATYPRRVWHPIKGTCPACGHRGYCTASEDGEVIKCQRAPSAHEVKQRNGMPPAWLHMTCDLKINGKVASKPRKPAKQLTRAELENLQKNYRTALTSKRLTKLSECLGISEKSLTAYGVGYATDFSARTACYSAPMVDGQKRICGIHLRWGDDLPEGDPRRGKASVRGSRNGLFLPDDFELFETHEGDAPIVLTVPEGLSDAATARDLGFRAIGRPSAAGGVDDLKELLASGPKQEVIYIVDNDDTKYLKDGTPYWPGIEGAIPGCEKILPLANPLKFALTPKGVKDLRKWVSGDYATTKVICDAVLGSVVVTADWIDRARARLSQRKKEERRKV